METTSVGCVGNGPSGGPGHSMHWQSVSHGSVGAQSGVEERAASHGETWVWGQTDVDTGRVRCPNPRIKYSIDYSP